MSDNTIQDAIAQAQAAAQNSAPAETGGVPATQSAPAAGLPATPAANVGGMDSFQTTSMSVDHFLKVKDTGLAIDDTTNGMFEEMTVTIDTNEVASTQAVKFNIGNDVSYHKTYDGLTATDGRPWAQVLEEARRADESARPYPSADVPMTLKGDLELKKETFEDGTTIGYSIPTTGGTLWAKFVKSVMSANLMGKVVEVKVGYQPRTKGKWSWGLVTFELIGPAEASE